MKVDMFVFWLWIVFRVFKVCWYCVAAVAPYLRDESLLEEEMER